MRKVAAFLALVGLALIIMASHDREELRYTPVPLANADALDGTIDGIILVPRQAPIDPWDVLILVVIIASFATCFVAMLVGAHRKRAWSWQALGMSGIYVGEVLFFWTILGPRITDWRTSEPYIDTIRSIFFVSGPVLMICLAHWMVRTPPTVAQQVETGRVAGYDAGLADGRSELT